MVIKTKVRKINMAKSQNKKIAIYKGQVIHYGSNKYPTT